LTVGSIEKRKKKIIVDWALLRVWYQFTTILNQSNILKSLLSINLNLD